MDVQRSKPNATTERLVVTLEPERVEAVFAAVSRRLTKNAQLPGFRPGRAPRATLERAMSAQIAQESREQLLQESVVQVLTEANIGPVAPPQLVSVGQIARGAMFTYTVECQVLAKIVLHKTEGLVVQQPTSSIDEAAVEARLAARRDEAASIEPVHGRDQVATGDWVRLSYTAEKQGKSLPQLAGQDVTIDTADQDILPELVQALVGSRVPGSCSVTLTLPASFHQAQLAGQTVTLHAELSELKTRVLPAVDDAFALDLGHSSLTALRAALRAELEAGAASRAKEQAKQSLLEALVAANPLEVPAALVDQEVEDSLKSTQDRYRQLTGQKMQQQEGGDGLRRQLRAAAQRRIVASLLLGQVAQEAGLSVDAAARQAAVDQQVHEAGDDQARVRAYFDDPEHLRQLEHSLLQQRAIEHLMARAVVQPAAVGEAAQVAGG